MPVKAGVVRAGERTTKRGAAETFTGVVFQDPVITANAPSRMGGSVVTFTPGARTAWHAHPVGQTLFCLSGIGRICFQGEKPQVLNPGDVVSIRRTRCTGTAPRRTACSLLWHCRKPASRARAPPGTTRQRRRVQPARNELTLFCTLSRTAGGG